MRTHPLGARGAPVVSRSTVLACALAAFAAAAPAQGPKLLVLSPQQVAALGVRTAPPRAAGAAVPLVLQGQVTLPPKLLRVLSAPVAAVVEQVHAGRGDALAAGRPLLALNAPQVVEWQREYLQAGLQLQLARQTAERDQALLAEGIIPGARAQASQQQLQIAQAALRERAQLLRLAGVAPDAHLSGRVPVAAPAAGTVLEVMVQPGQRVDAGTPLVKFAARGALALELQAAPSAARLLRAGDAVRVAGCDAAARVSSVNAQVEPGSQTVIVRAQWPDANECALPQQHVQAEVTPQSGLRDAAWLVPAAAVVRAGGHDTVYVQRPGGFEPLSVQVLGSAGADMKQVLAPGAGLKAADAVVVQGAVALKGLAQGLGAQ